MELESLECKLIWKLKNRIKENNSESDIEIVLIILRFKENIKTEYQTILIFVLVLYVQHIMNKSSNILLFSDSLELVIIVILQHVTDI